MQSSTRTIGIGAIAVVLVGGGAACGGGAPPKAPEPPKEEAAGGPPALSAPASDAERVVVAIKPKITKCYEDALKDDPKLGGAVKMVVKVAPDGAVTSALPAGNTTLSPVVVDCIGSLLRGAKFAPPGPSGSTIELPLSFKRKDD